jgi:hypothetical protein
MPSRKFDDAHWHWNGDYPAELMPKEDGDPAPIAHISFFLAWAVKRGLVSAEHQTPESEPLLTRTLTPWQYVERRVVYRLEDDDFNETGLAFATAYYRKKGPSQYFRDFCRIFDEAETGYHVEDSWDNYDRLEPELDDAFAWWQQHGTMDGWEDSRT